MNKNILHTVKGVAGCLLMASLAAGCAQEDIDTAPTGGGGMSASSYVSLSFASQQSTPTRSNPTGGEQGDGQEKGQTKENEIKSAVAFFYQGSGTDGVNSSGTTPIMAVATFNVGSYTEPGNGIDRTYTTTPQQVDLDDGTYNVLVVANPGADWWTGQSLTLADVRNHIQTTAWTASGSDYSDFVMTSAADATLTLNSNPENDPAKAEVNVERMAARLDYKAEASYPCTDPAYTGATVEITGAALVNNLTAGSYMLKRVASTVDGVPTYLGNETPDAGVQTNYVLDPWTADKTSANNSFTIGGEVKTAEDLYGEWFGNISQDPNHWADYVQPGIEVSDGTEQWQRIGYTLENTTAAEEAGKRYSTGVVFKAKFNPQGVANYTEGETFFAYGTKIYASMEDMMAGFYGSKFDDLDNITSCATWGDVKQFITSTLLTNDPSGYNKYLEGLAEGKDDSETVSDASSLTWGNYMLNECGYSKDENGKVVLDQNDKVTRIALQPYGTRTYEDATCYYTWWVRHSNDNDDTKKGIMEYAIVRNNIYKLTVNSVYSLGGEVPEEESLIVDVYVNDWLLLDNETLPM
ncbi:MAG: Mfa1 fimbrilin C-terminal domain-containing protein [Prevotella sp.]|uniref:Mfa1 family fimbria major subunit n=1 Tax=Prevotella sp. TaxID=59823 RepID=UPI00257E7EB5|nr:Mfa1 family fimbria major subunit [Prevotella sp.]MBS5876708.1 Mfa1 fimbrilin C-terminal domain-containing protein [Prevotella sp.]